MTEDGVVPIHEHLATVRRRLTRVEPHLLDEVLSRGGILVDIRPDSYRDEEGSHPEAFVIDRNVLEWRLDPASTERVDRRRLQPPRSRGEHLDQPRRNPGQRDR